MGGACCVAARDKNIVSGPGTDILHRNIRHSPTWSLRWDNRGRVAGEDPSIDWFSDGVTRSYGSDTKYELAYTSEDGSPLESSQRHTWQKSPTLEETGLGARTLASDQSISRNISTDVSLEQAEVKESTDVTVSSSSPKKLSLALPSTSSYSTSQLLSHNHLHPTGSTTPRWVHKSPGHRLTGHESGARYQGLKSSNSFVVGEERSLVTARANKSTRGTQGRSSDGWSMHAFSELVATSQRESWSPDNECLAFNHEKTRSIDRISSYSSIDLQTCGICSKLLTEKSLWSSQKLFVGNELGVVSVLTCGHVYHGECLETMTPEIDKYDPACPICTLGEKQTLKLSQKAFKAEMDLKAGNKRSKTRVVDRDLYGDSIDYAKANGQKGKGPKMASSSSMKSSLAKPFLWRHFSFGSKGNRSSTDIHTSRKKGFLWSRSMKA